MPVKSITTKIIHIRQRKQDDKQLYSREIKLKLYTMVT